MIFKKRGLEKSSLLFLFYVRRRFVMEYEYKEVYFDQYCKTCRFWNSDVAEDPCHECLNNPVNLYSHKPTGWKEKEK